MLFTYKNKPVPKSLTTAKIDVVRFLLNLNYIYTNALLFSIKG